jgi:hypothetical protein
MDNAITPTIRDWSPMRFMLIGTSLLVTIFAVVAVLSPPRDMVGATAIAVITGTAIGIERAIEVLWIFVSFRLGTWWPLQGLTNQLNTLIADLNSNYLDAFVVQAQQAISAAQAAGTATAQDLAAATKALTDLNDAVTEWQTAAPDNQHLRALVSLLSSRIRYLSQSFAELEVAAKVVMQAVEGVSGFVDSFKDNPGRRLISIYLGALIGMVVSGVLGLDIFQAGLDATPTLPSFGAIQLHPGVAITGIVIGLGSSPTHEVIRLLTEIKKNRRAENNRT